MCRPSPSSARLPEVSVGQVPLQLVLRGVHDAVQVAKPVLCRCRLLHGLQSVGGDYGYLPVSMHEARIDDEDSRERGENEEREKREIKRNREKERGEWERERKRE